MTDDPNAIPRDKIQWGTVSPVKKCPGCGEWYKWFGQDYCIYCSNTKETMSDYETPDFGYGNISIFYTHQFVQNDDLGGEGNAGQDIVCRYTPNYGPVITGTMSGKIVRDGADIQYFTVKMTDELELKDIGTQGIRAVGGVFDQKKNTLTLLWNRPPGSNQVVACYEYDAAKKVSDA